MARIRGQFQYEEPFHPLLGDVLRAFIRVTVKVDGRNARLNLQIDTGSDYTVLQPTGASTVLSEAYDRIDFESDPARIDLYGVSGGPSEYVIRNATLTFRDEQGDPVSIDLPVLIARPSTPQPTPDSNWEAPSLLGQDALRSFDLHLSYNPPTLTLTDPATA